MLDLVLITVISFQLPCLTHLPLDHVIVLSPSKIPLNCPKLSMLTPSHLTIHSLLLSCAKMHLRVDSESDNKLNSTLTPCSLVQVPTNLRMVFSRKKLEIQFSLTF